jgi:hypothetical protein
MVKKVETTVLSEAPVTPLLPESSVLLETFSVETSPKASNPDEVDRVADLTQKEKAAHKAGVTRYKYLKIIAEALEAEVVTREFDASKKEWVETRSPDEERRRWGAEQTGKFFSDFKEQSINIGVGVTVQLSPEEQGELSRLREGLHGRA